MFACPKRAFCLNAPARPPAAAALGLQAHIAWCIQYAYDTNVDLEAAGRHLVTQTWLKKKRSELVVNYKGREPATMEALAASASKMAVALRVVLLAVLGAVTVDGQPPFGASTDALRVCNMGCIETYVFLTLGKGKLDGPSNAYRDLYKKYVVEHIVSVHKALLAYGPSHTPRAACLLHGFWGPRHVQLRFSQAHRHHHHALVYAAPQLAAHAAVSGGTRSRGRIRRGSLRLPCACA